MFVCLWQMQCYQVVRPNQTHFIRFNPIFGPNFRVQMGGLSPQGPKLGWVGLSWPSGSKFGSNLGWVGQLHLAELLSSIMTGWSWVLGKSALKKWTPYDYGGESFIYNGWIVNNWFLELKRTRPVAWSTTPVYLHLIFVILQFEISSLMNWIFTLFQTWILLATAGRKNPIYQKISNWRIAKIKCR